MKNIHVLPTSKPSRLRIRDFDNKLCLHTDEVTYHGISQHIYITNDEETKLKDWFISSTLVLKATDILDCDDDGELEIHSDGYCNPLSLVKKIILTDDKDLIADGVQAIDDEFLEWFVKNPSCEKVEIIKTAPIRPFGSLYKVIIPKPTQQIIDEDFNGGLTMGQIIPQEETICIQTGLPCGMTCFSEEVCNRNVYTEQEVLVLLHKRDVYNFKTNAQSLLDWQTPKEWFEQFKNK
jgi:hypothetical protein